LNPTAGLTNFLFGTLPGKLTACESSTQCVTYSPPAPIVAVADVQASVQPGIGSSAVLSPTTAVDKFSYGQQPLPIEFLLPNALFGIQSASVFLDGAATGGMIALTSSDPNVVRLQPFVAINAGLNSVSFPVEFLPSSITEDVTLGAAYGGGSATATAHIVPWPALRIALNWAVEFPANGQPTYAVTVFINGLAPAGGAVVSLQSSDPSILPVPASVTIPAGSYWTTLTVATSGSRTTESVTISGKYNGATASASTLFVCTPPPKRRCRKGYSWNDLDCQCEQGTKPR
jgi:hypothetical protein